jgi:deazaflavin-dependent oxidoreductase (nitroreductase family)
MTDTDDATTGAGNQAPPGPRRRRWPPAEGAWFDVLGKAGLTPPLERALVRYTGVSLVTWATRVNRGLEYIPTLLLTTVGRQSGELRDKALGYYVDGGRVVIVGSVGGAARHPDWYRNLVDHPLVWLTINRRCHPCDTHTATGEERERIWATIKARIPEYEVYERRSSGHGREMPVVVCTPRRPIPGLRPW